MAPSTPRKRQQVAPPSQKITNFFKPASSVDLPESVQSDLVMVGMRIRKSITEGYKSGSYAFNKHLPSVGLAPAQPSAVSHPASAHDNPTKKRTFDTHEAQQAPAQQQAPASITAWARSVKVPTGAAALGKKNRAFYQAVGRKETIPVPSNCDTEDFGEADFLRPVDEMEM